MSLLGAINNASAGLAAMSQAIEEIAGRVAHMSAPSEVRSDTSFDQLVQEGASDQTVSGTPSSAAADRPVVVPRGSISISASGLSALSDLAG